MLIIYAILYLFVKKKRFYTDGSLGQGHFKVRKREIEKMAGVCFLRDIKMPRH